jgi:hypothetical protein
MVTYPNGKPPLQPIQFAIVKIGPNGKSYKKDLPHQFVIGSANGIQKSRNPSHHPRKPLRGPKPRNASKAH